jgi:hypothetical protein
MLRVFQLGIMNGTVLLLLLRDMTMDNESRERLATEFSKVIRSVREEKWDPFCEAAKQASLDPYTALARLLVRMVEEAVEVRMNLDSKEKTPLVSVEPKGRVNKKRRQCCASLMHHVMHHQRKTPWN